MLWGYFDESGKFADSDFVCLCGYLGQENFIDFSLEWKYMLARFGMRAVHTARTDWKNPEEVARLNCFASIIRRHAILGYSVAVDAKYFKTMPREKKKLLGGQGCS